MGWNKEIVKHTIDVRVYPEESAVNLQMNLAQEVAGLAHRKEVANHLFISGGST